MSRMHSGIPNAYNRYVVSVWDSRMYSPLLTLDLYFRGSEDDSESVETCRPIIAFYEIKL